MPGAVHENESLARRFGHNHPFELSCRAIA
jgi:hypothetical protein